LKTSTPGPFDAAVGGPPVNEPVNRLVDAVGSSKSGFAPFAAFAIALGSGGIG
jgi:hypothetical protein